MSTGIDSCSPNKRNRPTSAGYVYESVYIVTDSGYPLDHSRRHEHGTEMDQETSAFFRNHGGINHTMRPQASSPRQVDYVSPLHTCLPDQLDKGVGRDMVFWCKILNGEAKRS